MEPNFSLFLSSDGIVLQHRTPAGWQSVGTADVQSLTLDEDLAMLRETAGRLAPEGIGSVVVLPEDQIRLMQIEVPRLDETARTDAARKALDGSTPYPVDALAIDTTVIGDTTHVAAVALETLDEAETFALAHGFNPVCFEARVDAEGLTWEPAFGPTRASLSGVTAASPTPDADMASGAAGPDAAASEFKSARTASPTTNANASDDANRRTRQVNVQSPHGQRTARTKDVSYSAVGAALSARPRVVALAGVIALAGVAVLFGWMPGAGPGEDPAERTSAIAPSVEITAPPSVQKSDPPPLAEPAIAAARPQITEPRLSDEDAAVLDALAVPDLPQPSEVRPTPDTIVISEPVLPAMTAAISPDAPQIPETPTIIPLEDLYVPGTDAIDEAFDAVALPDPAALDTDLALVAPPAPAPAGTRYDLDDRGLVVATPQGALTPDGMRVVAGRPPQTPPELVREVADEDAARLLQRTALSELRPRPRPADIAETNERASFDGRTRSELATLRPRIRPASAQETAAIASLVPLDATPQTAAPSGTALAVATSLRPDARPSNFQQIVARSRANVPAPAAAAPVRRAAASPKIPSNASTSREATLRGAINLRKVNLIGVYGKPSQRRALVRLSNGRYEKVKVGDPLDGGKISAIGDSELRYQKSGRSFVLKMPKS